MAVDFVFGSQMGNGSTWPAIAIIRQFVNHVFREANRCADWLPTTPWSWIWALFSSRNLRLVAFTSFNGGSRRALFP